VNEIFALLGCYKAQIGSYLPNVSGQPAGPIFKGLPFKDEAQIALFKDPVRTAL
jgi:hypothetical protein